MHLSFLGIVYALILCIFYVCYNGEFNDSTKQAVDKKEIKFIQFSSIIELKCLTTILHCLKSSRHNINPKYYTQTV